MPPTNLTEFTFQTPAYANMDLPAGRVGYDAVQPTLGYFAGGGWTFGMLETTRYRVSAGTYADYKLSTTGTFVLTFRDTVTGATLDRLMQTTNPAAANYVRPYSDLTELDRNTFDHDAAIADIRESTSPSWRQSMMLAAADDQLVWKTRVNLLPGFNTSGQDWANQVVYQEYIIKGGLASFGPAMRSSSKMESYGRLQASRPE